jgi:hypothetical protein
MNDDSNRDWNRPTYGELLERCEDKTSTIILLVILLTASICLNVVALIFSL